MAEEAARRQRMSLSEWLDTVVTDKTIEAKPVLVGGSDVKQAPPRGRPIPPAGFDEDRASLRTEPRGRGRDADREPFQEEPLSRLSPNRARSHDEFDAAHARSSRRAPRLDDVEVMLEETLDDVERRVAKAQRRTDLALADLAELIKASDSQREASHTAFSQVADRLKSIETELKTSRESATEDTSRAKTQIVPTPDAANAAAAQMQRLEAKLNSVLIAVSTPKPERLPPKAQAAGEILREAVDEIADRQRDLGETRGPGPLAARLNQRRNATPAGTSDTALALTRMQRDIAGLSEKLDEVKREVVGPLVRRTSEETLARTREEIAALSEGLLPFERIENEIATLARRIDRDPVPPGPPEPPQFGRRAESANAPVNSEALLRDLRAQIDALSGKVSETNEVAADIRPAGALSRRLDRMRDPRPAPEPEAAPKPTPQPEPQADAAVSGMVDTLAEKLEAARQPDASQAAIAALQADIARLSERLNRPDSAFEAIAALQQSVSELFGQLEETRRATEDTARVRGGTEEPVIDTALAQEVAELRGLQDQAERRSNATLNAVHATLQKVVERLSRLDSFGVREPRALDTARDLDALAPSEPGAPRAKGDGGLIANLLRGRQTARGPQEEPGAPAVVPDEDRLIEPGAGFPGATSREPDAELPLDHSAEPVATKRADFIAAARRAAQTAQQEAEAIESGRHRATAAADAGLAQSIFEGRKRVIILSLAALFVVAGSFVAMRELPRQTPQKIVSSVQPAKTETPVAPATEAPAAAPAKAGEVKTAVAEPVDPTPVASIAPKTAAPLQPPPLLATPPAAAPSQNLRVAAEAGLPGAQYELATRYAEGRQQPRDLKLAAQWYEKAALQGLAPAQYRLGSMYEKGLGVTRDLGRAKTWYQKAADAGNARAMHNLAVLTAEGTDNKPDYAGAASWFRKAAELGIRDSQYNLAILLARGLGQPVNLVQSYAWFAAAAAQGDDDAAKKRDEIGARLEAKDMAAARAIADAYRPIPLDPAANDVAPPAGGWDTAVAAPPAQGVKLSKPKTSAL